MSKSTFPHDEAMHLVNLTLYTQLCREMQEGRLSRESEDVRRKAFSSLIAWLPDLTVHTFELCFKADIDMSLCTCGNRCFISEEQFLPCRTHRLPEWQEPPACHCVWEWDEATEMCEKVMTAAIARWEEERELLDPVNMTSHLTGPGAAGRAQA